MRILLGNLPWRKNGRFGVRAGSRWPFTSPPEKKGYINYIPFPFTLAYATALLKKHAQEAKLIDAIAENIQEEDFIAKAVSYNPELAIFEVSTPSFNEDIRIIKLIKKLVPDCKIALCGPHATVFAEQIINHYREIDFIFLGEYEITSLELSQGLAEAQDLKKVKGLALRFNQKAVVNRIREPLKNIDSFPWPDREDVPIFNYNDEFAGLPTPNVQLWSSRGCSFKCTFCLWPQVMYGNSGYRKRKAKDVVNEVEWLIKNHGFKAFYFDDDTFNIDREHVLSVCREIKNKNIKTPWAVMARADLMDGEMLKEMKEAGLFAIKYGIESASQKLLNSCQKNIDLEKVKKIIKMTKESGIRVHLTFCLGLPGENRQTIEETKKFISDTRPDSFQVSLATPFPGTQYYNYLKNNDFLCTGNWDEYDGNLKCIVRTEELTSLELEGIRDDFCNSFNL